MQHDEMIWQVISQNFCSFKTTIGKAKSDKTHFCRNPYSVTGLCNRTSCPLANSRYATVRESNGRVHLLIKTAERAHSPKNSWERIALSRSYGAALAQLDEHLAHFPKALLHRNKQRLTKIHQYLIRMRKLELRARAGRAAKAVGVHRRLDQREERRERKALVAARLEQTVEKELVQRLAKGTYGDIYNLPEAAYRKALDRAEEDRTQQESDSETEDEAEEEVEEEEDEEEQSNDGMVEYVEDLDTDDEEELDEEDMENVDYLGYGKWGKADSDDENDDNNDNSTGSDVDPSSKGAKKSTVARDKKRGAPRRGPRIEIEYEEETEHHAEATAAVDSAW